MKAIFINGLICICTLATCFGQQWINKQYSYDSILNVTYGKSIAFNGLMDSHEMDIYLPKCKTGLVNKPRPLIMFIHGGGFLEGNKDDFSIQTYCRNFAQRGYVSASINYRLGIIGDEILWQCNFPNYSCIFATDSAEWYRAYYRAIQDAKGALRYLINRHNLYLIDTNNIFVVGESAGAMTALGVGLMDTIIERPINTGAISAAPVPHSNTKTCSYYGNHSFSGTSIPRPDLGGIDGTIEPTTIKYSIKGIGNIYGAMISDLLKHKPAAKNKPAIYSFHQPCDLLVPIDSNFIFWGLSWCFTNGYGCFSIANSNFKLYGSRAFSTWNTKNVYGYNIKNEFTTTTFPYSYLFGNASCVSQVNNPCHAYDNRNLRETNMAIFFAPLISTSSICDSQVSTTQNTTNQSKINIFPNPTENILFIDGATPFTSYFIKTVLGNTISYGKIDDNNAINVSELPKGIYFLELSNSGKPIKFFKY